MKSMKKVLAVALATSLALGLTSCGKGGGSSDTGGSSDPPSSSGAMRKFTIATVARQSGDAWFRRLETGVTEFRANTGENVYCTAPEKADTTLQAQVIESLIAKKVDAICVMPYSSVALEPVLRKAREAGILVITEGASGMNNIDCDLEAFDNAKYGEHFMMKLGELTGGKGKYIQEVGTITSESQTEWADASELLQEKKFPGLSLLGGRIETEDDESVSYDRVKDVLKTNPDLAGIEGSSMNDVVGAALAVKEAGLSGKVRIVGTSLVSAAGKYIKSGTVDMISFWDPANAAYAMNALAKKMLDGQKLADGMNLGVDGYRDLSLSGKTLTGDEWTDVTKANVGDPKYDF